MPDRDLRVQFLGDAKDLIRAADKAQRAMGEVEDSTTAAGTSMGLLKKGALALGGAFAASRLKDFVGQSIQLGVAAEEAGNKFAAVFGPSATTLGATLDALGDKAGIADFELRNMTATTGNVVQGLGATTEEAAALVAQLAPAAVDVASFNGEVGNSPEVLHAMTSALTGEREALKTYGIVIREADVKTQALAETGKTTATELTNLEKANATLTLIMEGMANATGDLDRNLDTAATQQARLNAEWKEAQAELGGELLPVMVDLAPVMSDLIDLMGPLAQGLGFVVDNIHSVGTALATDMTPWQVDEMKQAIDAMVTAIANGMDPTTALTAALSAAAVSGSLTEDAFREIAAASGLSADQIDTAAAAAHNWATDAHGASNETELLADKSVTLAGAAKRAADEIRGVADEEDFWRRANDRTRPSVDGLAEATDNLTTSTEGYIQKQEELINPLARVASKQDDARKAAEELAAVMEDSTSTFEDIREAAFDAASANASLDAATQNAAGRFYEAEDALRVQLEALGLTDAQIRAIIDSLDILDGTTATFTIEGQESGIGLPPGFTWPAPGAPVKLAGGGKITKGGLAVVGEEGPEMVSLPSGAEVVPNSASVGMGGGTTVIPISIGGRVIEEIVIDAQRRITRRGRAV